MPKAKPDYLSHQALIQRILELERRVEALEASRIAQIAQIAPRPAVWANDVYLQTR